MKGWHIAAGVIALLILLRGTMQLSKNFSLAELTHTNEPFPNDPTPTQTINLEQLAVDLLQPIRDRWGVILVSSGFRSLEVNRAVGGSVNSDHREGKAGDIVPVTAPIKEVFNWIVNESGLEYGQVIYEVHGLKRWIHISLPRARGINQQALLLINGVTSHA